MRLAVLIDAENVSPRLADQIFARARELGEVRVRRVYGGFSGPGEGWADAVARHALELRPCYVTSKRKNGADIMLASEATELLRDGDTDAFLIVSSDGDFAGLALRIRRDGRSVFGVGDAKAPARYRDAFTRFFCIEEAKGAKPATKKAHPAERAIPVLRAALVKCTTNPDGSCNLSELGHHARLDGVTPKAYGLSSFSALVEATGAFEVEKKLRVRPKPLRAIVGGQ